MRTPPLHCNWADDDLVVERKSVLNKKQSVKLLFLIINVSATTLTVCRVSRTKVIFGLVFIKVYAIDIPKLYLISSLYF